MRRSATGLSHPPAACDLYLDAREDAGRIKNPACEDSGPTTVTATHFEERDLTL